MRIIEVRAQPDCKLYVASDDGRTGLFDVAPYLEYEAFISLEDCDQFQMVSNGGYFVEWACGADLSADTINARWCVLSNTGDNASQPNHELEQTEENAAAQR